MEIKVSEQNDVKEIFRLYNLASAYQISKKEVVVWPKFELAMVENEIAEQRQFKLLIDNEIACVWAITFSDPEIWNGSENDEAIYIHRIATNPKFRGNNFVLAIVEWSKNYAKQHDKNLIRLDTCGNNLGLINHYKKCGFEFLGMEKIKSFANLPSHYHNADVCYFEIKL